MVDQLFEQQQFDKLWNRMWTKDILTCCEIDWIRFWNFVLLFFRGWNRKHIEFQKDELCSIVMFHCFERRRRNWNLRKNWRRFQGICKTKPKVLGAVHTSPQFESESWKLESESVSVNGCLSTTAALNSEWMLVTCFVSLHENNPEKQGMLSKHVCVQEKLVRIRKSCELEFRSKKSQTGKGMMVT